MSATVGLDLMAIAMLYGYCLAAQPQYATAGGRLVASWTFRQRLAVRCGVGFAVWLVWMTGLYLFIRHTG